MQEQAEKRVNRSRWERIPAKGIERTSGPVVCLIKTFSGDGAIREVEGGV